MKQEFVAIGDALQAADPHGRMIGIHPMTKHGSVREFVGTRWMAFGDYQQNYYELHDRVLESRPAQLPVVNSEYGYYLRDQNGDGVPDKDNSTSLSAMRHASWDIVMAGGYVVTGFGTTYFGGNRDPGPFDLHAEKNDAWEEQVALTKAIFSQLEWWKLEPHDELLACETKRGSEADEFMRVVPPRTTYWCLAQPGRQYLVYFRGLSEPLQLRLGAESGPLSVTRINPRTGESSRLGTTEGPQLTILPHDEHDWVIRVAASGE